MVSTAWYIYDGDIGFKGASCTQSDKEEESLNYSPALLGLIASLFVVIVLLVGGVFFMIKQLSAYKEDFVNYHVCPYYCPSLQLHSLVSPQ